jgi:hypothetical protein
VRSAACDGTQHLREDRLKCCAYRVAWYGPWRPCTFRHHPALRGNPTTISTPLRQAIALGIRLGCPLQQIFHTWLAYKLHGRYPDTVQRPGLRIYSLCKARTLFLGQTVNASFCCAVSAQQDSNQHSQCSSNPWLAHPADVATCAHQQFLAHSIRSWTCPTGCIVSLDGYHRFPGTPSCGQVVLRFCSS